MNISDITRGGIYRLNFKPEVGTEYVRVDSIQGANIICATGKFTNGTGFVLKTYFDAKGCPVRKVTLTADAFAELIEIGEITMTEQENTGAVKELTVELDEQQGAADPAKPKALTVEEQIAEIDRRKKEEIEAIKQKQAAKEKAATDRRVDKLTKAAEKAGAKEADIAAEFGDGAKKFEKLTEEQTKAALAALAERAKDYAAEQKKVNKFKPKVEALVTSLKAKEADVATEFGGEGVKKFAAMTGAQLETAYDALKKRVKEQEKENKLALVSKLSDEEADELKKLEKVVDKNLASFQNAAMVIGGALAGINQKRLYRESHKTFEAYVQDRFGLSRPHAYSVIAASQTFQALTENEMVDAKTLPSLTAAEAITRGVTKLLKEANLDNDPEAEAITRQMARNVFQIAVQNAPTDKDGKAILSPAHLESTFKVLGEVAKTGLVEIDGVQVPVNIAAATIDEMITTESHERVQRMKAGLIDRITAAEQSIRDGKAGSRIDAALNSASAPTGDIPIPTGTVPKLTAICSVHSRQAIKDTSDTDLTLECGCVFINTPEGFIFEKSLKYPTAAA